MTKKKDPPPLYEMEVGSLGVVKTGDKLKHPIFGRGVAEEMYIWESGERIIRVKFKKHGSKALVPEYSNLKRRLW